MRYIDLHNDVFDGFYEIQLHEFFFFNCVLVNLTLITRGLNILFHMYWPFRFFLQIIISLCPLPNSPLEGNGFLCVS